MKKIIYPLLVVIFSFPAIMSLLHSGFPLTDDGNWMIVRFSAFYEALRSGQFPVRFLPRLNNGLGYPVADFLYPLFMYIGVPIKAIGFSFINTIKIILAGSIIASGLFCFLWLSKLFSKAASLMGALCFVYFPYHLWDIYKRGSVGEVLALAIAPFIFWQIERKSVIWTSIGIAFLITAHNTLALLFLPLIYIYLFLSKKLSIRGQIGSLIFALGLSAFFWIPALYDKQFTVFDQTVVSSVSSYFITGTNITLLGSIFFFTIVYSGISLWFSRNTKTLFFFIVTLLSVFLVFPFSAGIWSMLPGKNLIQFPFRLLSIVVLSTAYLAAANIDYIGKRFTISASVLTLVLIFVSAWTFLQPKIIQNYPDGYYTTNTDTTTVKNEYMPLWVKTQNSKFKAQNIQFVSGSGIISNIVSRGTKQQFNVQANKQSLMQLPIIYFPGWIVLVDNKSAKIIYTNSYGLIQFQLDSGNHTIRSYFSETPIRFVGDIISIISICSIIILSLLKKKYD